MSKSSMPDALLVNGAYQFSDDEAPLLTVQFHNELDELLTPAERFEVGRAAIETAVMLLRKRKGANE